MIRAVVVSRGYYVVSLEELPSESVKFSICNICSSKITFGGEPTTYVSSMLQANAEAVIASMTFKMLNDIRTSNISLTPMLSLTSQWTATHDAELLHDLLCQKVGTRFHSLHSGHQALQFVSD